MDAIQLLRKFAESQGINKKEVDKFLSEFNKPKTLNDVISLPHDMQLHEKYITWLKDPLKSFISDEIYDGRRCETIKVDRVVDRLYDHTYYLLDDDDLDIDEVGFENLTTDDESKNVELEKLKSIAKCIIDIKFGSVKMDW